MKLTQFFSTLFQVKLTEFFGNVQTVHLSTQLRIAPPIGKSSDYNRSADAEHVKPSRVPEYKYGGTYIYIYIYVRLH